MLNVNDKNSNNDDGIKHLVTLIKCLSLLWLLLLSTYRVFSHDVTAAILVFKNNETAAMLVYQEILWELNSFLM